jgi:hypothetical protein
VTALWINFRHDLGRYKVAEGIRTLVQGLVFGLCDSTPVLASRPSLFCVRAKAAAFLTKDQKEYSAYPTPFEAILGAEETLHSHLLAFGAL